MEEEKRETPIQPTQFVKSEPVVTQKKPAPEIGKGISFDKLWFIPVILALVVLIVVGALWVMNKGLLAPKPSPSPVPTASPVAEIDESTTALEEQGTSDEISVIESDLNATDLSQIDKELSEIESELSSP